MKTNNELVEASRNTFDAVLHTQDYHNLLADDVHLDNLLQMINVEEKARLLDLGTGAGYVAFEMARRWPERQIVGVDVARRSISIDQNTAEELNRRNVKFYPYEGIKLPFQHDEFNGVICRYAFHHCPEPQTTVSEMSRVLKADGIVVLSDPVPTPPDNVDFVDAFQRLRPDGHICFHPKRFLVDMFDREGFMLVDYFESSITYPREIDERYKALLGRTSKAIQDAYRIVVDGDKISITVNVLNSLFKRV